MGKRGRRTQYIKCNTCLMIDKSRIASFGKKYIGTQTGMDCVSCCKEHDGSIKSKTAKRCRACCPTGHFTRNAGSIQGMTTPSKLPCEHIRAGTMEECPHCCECNRCCKCDPDKEVEPRRGIGEIYFGSLEEKGLL